MLTPRPTKLRSQRDINLWRIPLQLSLAAVVLFGITLIPDTLDKYGVIHIPSWLTMGSIDDARAIRSAMMDAVATVLALIFSVALLRTPADKRCRIKQTQSWKPRARWSRLIAATSMRRGTGHTPRSKCAAKHACGPRRDPRGKNGHLGGFFLQANQQRDFPLCRRVKARLRNARAKGQEVRKAPR